MYIRKLLLAILLCVGSISYSQTIKTVRDSIVSKSNRLPSAATVKAKSKQIFDKYLNGRDSSRSSVDSFAQPLPGNPAPEVVVYKKEYHTGWPDGRVAEFNNAYTLRSGEVRLNLFGRSTVALSRRSELSSYLPLIIMPNLFYKHRFIDTRHFAAAYETGGAFGIIPVAFATGLIVPGAVFGAGGLGIFTGNDVYGKLYFSYKPSTKITISARASASRFAISYHGLAAFAGAGGSGEAVVGVVPTNFKIVKTYYYMVGGEIDYVFRQRNSIVLNASYSRFDGQPRAFIYPSVYFTRAVKKHFHYSLGLYHFFDVPARENVKSELPVNLYWNFYWILNNGRKVRVN
jgi:hypothetical protein